MDGTVSVLAFVGDGPTADAISQELDGSSDRVVLSVPSDVETGMSRLEFGDVDCVVASAAAVEADADLLDRLRERDRTIPVVAVLDADATATPAELLERGATDFVRLGDATAGQDVLATRIEHATLAARVGESASETDGPDAGVEAGADAGTDAGADAGTDVGANAGPDGVPGTDRRGAGARDPDLSTLSREALERRMRAYESIIRALPDEIAIVSDDGEMIDVIPPTGQELTMAGYHPDEIRGEPLTIALTDETVDRAWTVLDEVATGDRERGTFEMTVETTDGRRLLREGHIALLEAEDGSIRGSVTVLRDIEERKAYERELERQNERLERFASITSHDLRNPLTIAQGHAALLADECDSGHVETVAEALARMERLIDDTLTWARQGATVDAHQPVSLDVVASESWAAVDGDDATLRVRDDLLVMGDVDRVRRLLENLLRNAVEHGGADVHVEIGAIDGGGEAEETSEGGPAGFYVADDGPGIPPAKRDEVFDAGVTTASDGTGFGLAIIAEICEAHGWEIDVTESEAGGARFEITGVELAD